MYDTSIDLGYGYVFNFFYFFFWRIILKKKIEKKDCFDDKADVNFNFDYISYMNKEFLRVIMERFGFKRSSNYNVF